jgi:hypothetical protein
MAERDMEYQNPNFRQIQKIDILPSELGLSILDAESSIKQCLVVCKRIKSTIADEFSKFQGSNGNLALAKNSTVRQSTVQNMPHSS